MTLPEEDVPEEAEGPVEQVNVFVSVLLFAMAAFVACGRWMLKPF